MKASELTTGKFMKKEDCEPAILVTIAGFKEYNVAQEGQAEEKKWAVLFQEIDKPLVLNQTNVDALVAIFGTDDTDAWVGHKIVCFCDPTVKYMGRVVGGVRIRAPRPQAPQTPAPVPQSPVPVAPNPALGSDDDGMPF